MKRIKLCFPEPTDAEAVWSFRRACQKQDGEHIPGSSGLSVAASYADWLEYVRERRTANGADMVPSTVFLARRMADGLLVGIVDIRHGLNDELRLSGGNIGYTVLPACRRQGYGKEILSEALQVCKALGLERVLVTCDKSNVGSAGVIRANGGILENEIYHNGVLKQRYWIEL
jgi:predicted acetyltransferase